MLVLPGMEKRIVMGVCERGKENPFGDLGTVYPGGCGDGDVG